MINRIRKYLDVSITDVDNRRRARLLNIAILGFGGITLLVIVGILVVMIFRPGAADFRAILISAVGFLVAAGFVLWLNRRGNVLWASSLFLIAITLALIFANLPALASGVTMFYFVIPVMMSSVLIRPQSSFLVACLIGITLGIIGLNQHYPATFYIGTFGLLAIALVSWISSRSLENALKELRLINEELDRRVMRRTQELEEANLRLEAQASELTEANQRLEQQTRELSDANEKLKSLDRLKSKFVSDVTHELRTPISNLTIYMEMVRLNKSDKRERYLNVLQEEIARLAKLVEDVLDLTRMELGTRKVEFNWVDMNDVTEQVVMANRLRAESKGLTITFEPGKNVPAIWADPSQMKQVVTNLVANAVNYTLKGSVTLTTRFDPDLQQVSVLVNDTGMGVSPEDKPHLFERFYRGILASQSAIPGTGLGLAITKEIVDLHGGQIEVDSQLGVGSTFVVHLPVGGPGKEPKTSPLGKKPLS